MFAAALILERDPSGGANLLEALFSWVQIAGGFAAVGIVLWGLVYGLRQPDFARGTKAPPWVPQVILIALIIAGLAYAVWGAIKLPDLLRALASTGADSAAGARAVTPPSAGVRLTLDYSLFIGGLASLVVVLLPIGLNLPAWRGRRIWALTKLAFLEAVRRRVLWVFAFLLIPFLFPAAWWSDIKSENEVRVTVTTAFFVIMLLLGVAAALLAAFGLNTDIRTYTIHTVVTKPVERFEIALGRFFGYSLLLALMLAGMTALSLFFILATRVSPEAAEESFKARKPLLADELRYLGVRDEVKGENVGREWEYRGYISGPNPGQPDQYAVWNFRDLPARLAQRDWTQCEFTFDIYRTTKGEEGRGVACSFFFEVPSKWQDRVSEYNKELADALRAEEKKPAAERRSEDDIKRDLAKKYGYYEVLSKRIEDYHTGAVRVPGTLFEAAREAAAASKSGEGPPPLRVRVRCISRTQYVGMAPYDLYFRLDDPDVGADKALFAFNFCKGALGIGCRLVLIIGVAVACSTYLSGAITLLVTAFLYVFGIFREFVVSVADGKNFGGGPLESAVRLFNPSAVAQGVEPTVFDEIFRFGFRVLAYLLPDVERFDLGPRVAAGFDISLTHVLFGVGGCLPYLIAYLIPWFILTFYLIRSREIAGNF